MFKSILQRLQSAVVLAGLSLMMAMPARAAESAVGLARFPFVAPGIAEPINAYVFYPAINADRMTRIGLYEVAAGMEAAVADGRKPLLIVSHGQGGSALGHHDLASFLAANGYIVASLEHPRDNVRDGSGVGTPDVLLGRPRQVSALIDALQADGRWGPRIDTDRIGVAGFSMGGYTSLALMGARPDFLRLLEMCKDGVEPGVCALLAEKGATLDPETPIEAYVASLQTSVREAGTLSDPRIKAAFVMAPMALVFDAKSLEGVTGPVYLHYGTADRMLAPSRNADNLIKWLPGLAGRTAIVGSDHWVYLAPCSSELAAAAPEICHDAPGIDRAALHVQIGEAALAFFNASLRP